MRFGSAPPGAAPPRRQGAGSEVSVGTPSGCGPLARCVLCSTGDPGCLRSMRCWRQWRGSQLRGEPAFSRAQAAGGSCGRVPQVRYPPRLAPCGKGDPSHSLLPHEVPEVELPKCPHVSAAPAACAWFFHLHAPWFRGLTAGLAPLSRRPGITLPGVQARQLAPAGPTPHAVILAEVSLFLVNPTLASPKFKNL